MLPAALDAAASGSLGFCLVNLSDGVTPAARLQNRACQFPGTRLLSDRIPVMDAPVPPGARGLPVRGSDHCGSYPLRSVETAPALRASAPLLATTAFRPPSPRQHILGITPGLGFLGNPPSRAMRWAPAPLPWRAPGWFPRSCCPFGATVGLHSPPEPLWGALGTETCQTAARSHFGQAHRSALWA